MEIVVLATPAGEWHSVAMASAVDIHQLSESELREWAAQMQQAFGEKVAELQERDNTIQRLQTEKEHLTHEIAILRRHRFGKRSEAGSKNPQQSLLDDLIEEDIAAIETELENLDEPLAKDRQRSKPRRQALPSQLPRTEIHPDPESTTCGCGCQLTRIGEDVSERLDYAPGTFSVERHIRSKWACKQCETVVQAPVAPHIVNGQNFLTHFADNIFDPPARYST